VNYRHAYHAGNFADVFKHVMLTRILLYLGEKPAAFRVIDTHAGEGIYDLASEAAEKTAEWQGGIGRLMHLETLPAEVEALLAPYRAIVAPYVGEAMPRYPGSPAIAAALLRKQDRMVFCEAHPEVARRLKKTLGRDRRAKIIEIDGFTGLKAYVPPVERRGLVLIDPPFEAKDEFDRIAEGLATALRKWPGGGYLIWFPIKDRGIVTGFYKILEAILAEVRVRDALRLELWIDDIDKMPHLVGNGLVAINPPYVLEGEAKILLPYLAETFAVSRTAGSAIAPICLS